MTTTRGMAAALAAALLAGCSLAPEYLRPALPVSESWPTGPAYNKTDRGGEASSVADLGWREFFGDARLKDLIALGLDNNRDLRVTALNIQKSRAQYAGQEAQLFPTIALQGSGNTTRTPADVAGASSPVTAGTYGLNAGLSSYEVDFFGKVQSLTNEALETYLATQDAQRSGYLSLVAEIATDYLALLADRERLRTAEVTLASQQASLSLTEKTTVAGTGTALAVAQARTSVESARADVSLYTRQVALDQNTLTLVVGAPIPLALLSDSSLHSVTAAPRIRAAIPSDVLLRRPDIVEAEHTLKAANADIGAARAAFFPSVTLTANGGTSSAALTHLFRAGSGAWVFAPQVNLPIFDGGNNLANLHASEAQRSIAVAQYEKSIQSAFKEVADALAVAGTISAQLSAQQALVAANADSYRLAQARFRGGIDSYLAVLTAQQSLYTSQQTLITIRLTGLTNRVTLYKTLGGGDREYGAGRQIAASGPGR
jgi:outer membrane protein, multidrug efflux system